MRCRRFESCRGHTLPWAPPSTSLVWALLAALRAEGEGEARSRTGQDPRFRKTERAGTRPRPLEDRSDACSLVSAGEVQGRTWDDGAVSYTHLRAHETGR